MPGRVSARTSTASGRVSHKSSAANLKDAIPDEGPYTAVRTQVCAVFADAHKTTAGHRKLVVNLRKVQERCCYEAPLAGSKKQNTNETEESKEGNEETFNTEVARCMLRMLVIKKSEGAGDRMVKFLGVFLKHASDKDMGLFSPEELEEAEALPETPTSRLTSYILAMLIPMLTAKEKTVRYRATEIVSNIVNSLDSIDDDHYHLVRTGLLKRIRDKEPTVRVQAVLGLGRLAGNEGDDGEDESASDEEAHGLLAKLLDVLQNDPSADVRRSLLLNLPLTPATLPYLLERARDLDPATRRALYARLLPALGDFRHLSLSMREKLLRWGLRDRDENVRKATARLFRERWIGDCAGTNGADASQEAAPLGADALLELLERIDVGNAGVEGGIAHEAMQEFWSGRPDYLAEVSLEGGFWDNLTAERAFLARSLNDFCREKKDARHDTILDEKMPEVTKLAFFIQRYTNSLIEQLRQLDPRQETESEEATIELEFVIEQLLHIAATVDYSDEIGRRKMFALLREMLALPELPDNITKLMIEVLRLICGTDAAAEREFCGVVLEAVAEVHDTITPEMPSHLGDEDESFHSARSEQSDITPTKAKGSKKLLTEDGAEDDEGALKEILVNLKCLHIAQCMLQNVGGALQANGHLVNMLNNLVVPAVRSHEAPIRERGLVCLGLCCLLDATLAEENLTLFLHCYSKGHPALQATALEILCDMLTANANLLSGDDNPLRRPIVKAFTKGLKAHYEPEVQAAATTSLCKLMLTRVLVEADLLKQLVVLFFEPSTREHAATRQALAYFLPVFAHSRRENMALLASVVPAVVHAVVNLGEELEEDEEMVGATVVANLLADWTDPRKLVVLEGGAGGWDELGRSQKADGDVHLDVAEGLLERAFGNGCPKEERKVLLSMLSKLFVTVHCDPDRLATVRDLAHDAITSKLTSETAARNALTKYVAALDKAIDEQTAAGKGRTGRSKDVSVLETVEEGESHVEDSRIDDSVVDADVGKGMETREPSALPDVGERSLLDEDDDDDDTATVKAEDDEEDVTMMEAPVGRPRGGGAVEQHEEDSVLDDLLDESGVDL